MGRYEIDGFFRESLAPRKHNNSKLSVEIKSAKDLRRYLSNQRGRSRDPKAAAIPEVKRKRSKARARRDQRDPVRIFIVDSGASEHVVSWKDLTKAEKKRVRRTAKVCDLNSANGIISTEWEVDLYIKELGGHKITCMVFENSPPLMSVGKLCMEDGFNLHWHCGQYPYLQYGTRGVRIPCRVLHHVPLVTPAEVLDQKSMDEELERVAADRANGSGSDADSCFCRNEK